MKNVKRTMKLMNSAIILLSGGLDSVVSLAVVREQYSNILALTFNYGQKSFQAEKKSSQKIAQYYNIDHEIIELNWLSRISTSSLNTNEDIPSISYSDLDNHSEASKSAASVWVPNRNGLFVNIAACYADAYGYDNIILGANKEEGATFKDNTIDFVNSVNDAFLYSVNKKVKLTAPLISLNKEEIVKEAVKRNVPFEYIHSCYTDGDEHCGECESCKRLKRALQLNNRTDIINKIFKQR